MTSFPSPAGSLEDGSSPMRLTMTVSLPPRTSSIGESRHILAVLLSLTAVADEAGDRLAVLITEACANAVQHGDAGASIDLRIAIDPGTCVLEVGNRGRVPNGGTVPTRLPDPDQPNGRGLPLIAALSDGAEFVATASGYVLLRMILRLRAHTHMRAGGAVRPVN